MSSAAESAGSPFYSNRSNCLCKEGYLLRTYFSFSGRMSLRDFWIKFNAGYLLIWLPLWYLRNSHNQLIASLWALFYLLSLWPHLAVMTKRFHDRGKPMWYFLLLFCSTSLLNGLLDLLPTWKILLKTCWIIVSAVTLVESLFLTGERKDNRFGPCPYQAPELDTSALQTPTA
jgi:uncharacterized membrane protein YhaH (DUF805 family)